MKKYLLGLFAVVLAVGFSAFTANQTKTTTTDFFWYSVYDDNGTLKIDVPVLSGQEKTESEALSYGCANDESQPICIVGYDENPSVAQGTALSSLPQDATIRETRP